MLGLVLIQFNKYLLIAAQWQLNFTFRKKITEFINNSLAVGQIGITTRLIQTVQHLLRMTYILA